MVLFNYYVNQILRVLPLPQEIPWTANYGFISKQGACRKPSTSQLQCETNTERPATTPCNLASTVTARDMFGTERVDRIQPEEASIASFIPNAV